MDDHSLAAATPLGEVTVRFLWEADRYRHEVGWWQGDQWIPALVSVEGDPEQDWPCSPPLQQLSREELPDGPALMGVGMAGRSHWSAVVEVSEDGLIFDVACRVHGTADGLSSSYHHQRAGLRLEPVDEQSQQTQTGPLQPSAPALDTIRAEACSGTVRWRYRVRREPPSAAADPENASTDGT